MFVFTYSRSMYEDKGIDKYMLSDLITKHRSIAFPKLQKCMDYYEGHHAIEEKERSDSAAPNFKTVCNHAKDISDTASGYFMGSPISFDSKDKDLTKLLEAFDAADVDDADQDNALYQSVCGVAYDYTYVKEDETELAVINLDSRHSFIVYDDSIEKRELFGVYYDVVKDDIHNTDRYDALVCDETYITEYTLYAGNNTDDDPEKLSTKGKATPHNLGYVPITEYQNNKFGIGDFETQIGLIDAYNTLMADRINDKEQFIDSILVLYGSILGDDDEETEEAMRELNRKKLLEMPLGAKAEFLSRTLDETSVETLRKALKEDIYTLSHVPNLTDAHFAGNSSGVAMEYKLLGLEMLTKVKERYYRKGLKKRIKMFCHFMNLKSVEIDAGAIMPTFSRSLPKNLIEIAQMITMLKGTVSDKTLVKLLPFVEDPDEEIEAVEEQQQKAIERQQKLFNEQEPNSQNTPPEGKNGSEPGENPKDDDLDE